MSNIDFDHWKGAEIGDLIVQNLQDESVLKIKPLTNGNKDNNK